MRGYDLEGGEGEQVHERVGVEERQGEQALG